MMLLWALGTILERSWNVLERLLNHLQASCAILSHLGGDLGLSEALLEPSWAILDALTAPRKRNKRHIPAPKRREQQLWVPRRRKQ